MGSSHSSLGAIASSATTLLTPTPTGSPRTTGPAALDLGLRHAPILAAASATTLNVTAIIDPSHATTGTAATATFAPPVASPTGPPHFLFVFGDSYSETGFNLSGTKPSALNPLGNPNYPGSTEQAGMQNWVDLLTVNAGVQALTYNFADGGAAINNSLTDGNNPNVPDLVAKEGDFRAGLATSPRPSYAEWNAGNSVFILWFGRNDIYWKVIDGSPQNHLDSAMNSLELIMTRLVGAGAQRFVLLGVSPFWREPLWQNDDVKERATQIPDEVDYWNSRLQDRLKEWRSFYPSVKLSWLDTTDTFVQVLDHPAMYGAPNALCKNDDPAGPTNGTDCLWADIVHPGPVLNAHVAELVGRQLQDEGYFENYVGTPAVVTTGSTGAVNTAAPAANGQSVLTQDSILAMIACLAIGTWMYQI